MFPWILVAVAVDKIRDEQVMLVLVLSQSCLQTAATVSQVSYPTAKAHLQHKRPGGQAVRAAEHSTTSV